MSKKLVLVLSSFVLLGIIGFVLIKSRSNKVVCEPATTPWKFEKTHSQEYYAGYYPNITITQVCSFVGYVTNGQYFSQKITQNLVFYLAPANGGWFVGVTNKNDKTYDMNMSVPVTVPYHGLTALDIWGLNSVDNVEGDEVVGSIENPVTAREFNFLLSTKAYKVIVKNNECWRYGLHCPADWGDIPKTPSSRGILTITKIKFGDQISKEWYGFEIESMDFEVKIYLPAELPAK